MKIKNFVMGTIAGTAMVFTIIGYASMAATPFIFVGLFLAKLLGFGQVSWFALTEVSVFITPVYTAVLGFIGFAMSGITAALAANEIK